VRVVLTALAGLTIDTGYLHLVKTRMQTAADAAAIGGSREIRLNGTANVVAAAQADATANGFAHGTDGVRVTVNNPPATGSYTSDPTAVEVLIQKNVATFFMGVLGLYSTTVKVRSVARLGSSPTCMDVLNSSANDPFQINGGVTLPMSCGDPGELQQQFFVSGKRRCSRRSTGNQRRWKLLVQWWLSGHAHARSSRTRAAGSPGVARTSVNRERNYTQLLGREWRHCHAIAGRVLQRYFGQRWRIGESECTHQRSVGRHTVFPGPMGIANGGEQFLGRHLDRHERCVVLPHHECFVLRRDGRPVYADRVGSDQLFRRVAAEFGLLHAAQRITHQRGATLAE
jgi:hypothetical protein